MASTRTLVVAVAVVAVFAQLSAATCPCGCASGSATYEYAAAAPAAASGAAVVEVQDDSWAREFPSNAIITNTQVNDNCAYNEIRMPDEAAPAIGIVRQPCAPAAQHLSYNIEVPVNQERPIVPSYHGVSVEVPVRARTVTQSFGPLGYSVEVPVQQEQSCQKLPNLPVEIAVPVRQRQLDIRQHSTYSVEVPAASALSSRLTNLKANVDRIVMPSYQGCVSGPNNAPVANQEVTYVAVPAAGPICTSPVGLLGLRKTFAPAAPAASSGPAPSSGSRGCVCPCD